MSVTVDHNRDYFLITRHLQKPLYVIAMGWPRWGKGARIHWVKQLHKALVSAQMECEEWLKNNDYPNPIKVTEKSLVAPLDTTTLTR